MYACVVRTGSDYSRKSKGLRGEGEREVYKYIKKQVKSVGEEDCALCLSESECWAVSDRKKLGSEGVMG